MTGETNTLGGWFEDEALFRTLRDDVVPRLRTYPSVMVWLPACGAGAFAYQLAIVLREEGLAARCRIYATDTSDAALEHARGGVYPIGEVAGAADAYLRSGGRSTLDEYFRREGDLAVIRPLLRDRIAFFHHDFTADASFNEFQLIIGRHVFPALAPTLAERVARLMDESLCRSGVVSVDRDSRVTEVRTGARYVPLDSSHFFHRKVA
jgi:chemotaxis protein methyltransferase CheR